MKKYRAPGAYARFIPTQNTIKSTGQMRVMALVGTGQQFFERKNVLINRQPGTIFDELQDENVVEIYSVSSKPVLNRIDSSNKIYTDYELKDGNLLKWKALEGPQFEAKVELITGFGDSAFLSNIHIDILDQDLVTDMEYKVEIDFVDEKNGTYKVINNKTTEMIGEYIISDNANYDIIPGLGICVTSTFVLDTSKVGEKVSKTRPGDYAIIKTISAKCHMEALVEKINASRLNGIGLEISNSGSNYNLPNAGQDAGAVTGPNVISKIKSNFNFASTSVKLKLYKDGILTNASEMFNKLDVSINGKIKGGTVESLNNLLFDISDAVAYPGNTVYDLTTDVPDNILNAINQGDDFDIKLNYVLNGSPAIDNSNIYMVLEISSIENDIVTGLSVEKKIGSINNIIFVRSGSLPKTVSDTNSIFYNLIQNLKVVNSGKVETATYKIEIINLADNTIVIKKIDKDASGNEVYTNIGSYSTDAVSDFREAIPGISFSLNSLNDVEGLIENKTNLDVVDGSSVIISTVAGVKNVNVPASNSSYYVSYKYAKSEEEYEPKIFYNYSEIRENYGKYAVTNSGLVINSLSLGAEIAMQNGASPIICVQAKNDTLDEMAKAIDKLSKKIGFIDNINAIIPLTTSKQVADHLIQHINQYSATEYSMYRMAYLGCELNEVVDKESTINSPQRGSIQYAKHVNNERIVYVVPGKVSRDVLDPITDYMVTRTLPACYLSVAVAAIAMSQDPAEPLTNKTVKGFNDLLVHYTEPEMNALADAGCLVLKQEGNVIKIRHGITTHGASDTVADIQSNEITLVQIKDFVVDGCRKTLGETFIGGKIRASAVNDVEYTLTQLLNKYIADEIIIAVEDLSVKRSQTNPTLINVKFLIEAVYPFNYIDIEFGFSTTIS